MKALRRTFVQRSIMRSLTNSGVCTVSRVSLMPNERERGPRPHPFTFGLRATVPGGPITVRSRPLAMRALGQQVAQAPIGASHRQIAKQGLRTGIELSITIAPAQALCVDSDCGGDSCSESSFSAISSRAIPAQTGRSARNFRGKISSLQGDRRYFPLATNSPEPTNEPAPPVRPTL